MSNDFTIRVYALLFNEQNELLITQEEYRGVQFNKFPGGGLEWGEGPVDTIKRELKEELNVTGLSFSHFYTTDFFVESYFDTSTQVFSIYFRVNEVISKHELELDGEDTRLLGLSWINLSTLSKNDVTFPIDKKVVGLLLSELEALRQ